MIMFLGTFFQLQRSMNIPRDEEEHLDSKQMKHVNLCSAVQTSASRVLDLITVLQERGTSHITNAIFTGSHRCCKLGHLTS